MPVPRLNETFDNASPDALLSWLNPPARWRLDRVRSKLIVEPGARTDFWQRTHYGFRASNGHLFKAEIPGDATITSHIGSYPVHPYDQAGLMVWFSSECWLKASVEFEPGGAPQLGAVVTNGGFSDWSMQDFEPRGDALSYGLRIRRVASDYFVEWRAALTDSWKPMRMAHLSPESGAACLAGLYACSPKDAGFRAEFDFLDIEHC